MTNMSNKINTLQDLIDELVKYRAQHPDYDLGIYVGHGTGVYEVHSVRDAHGMGVVIQSEVTE